MSLLRSPRAIAIGVLGFVLAVIVLFPMRVALGALALDRFGVTASAVHGSIWSGRIEDLHLGRLDLGTMDASLSPVQLLLGRARLDLSRRNDTPADLSGAVSVSRNSVGIDDATGTLPMAGLLAPLPISAIELDDVSVRFTGGACERAEGRVRARISLIGQAITGSMRCDGTRALLLFGDPGGPARIELRIAADGSYTGTMVVGNGAAGAALSMLGFAKAPGGFRLEVNGRLR